MRAAKGGVAEERERKKRKRKRSQKKVRKTAARFWHPTNQIPLGPGFAHPVYHLIRLSSGDDMSVSNWSRDGRSRDGPSSNRVTSAGSGSD